MDSYRRTAAGYENVSQREKDVYFNEEKIMDGEKGRKENVSTSRSKSRIFTIGGLFAVILLITGFTHSNRRGQYVSLAHSYLNTPFLYFPANAIS